MQVLKKLSFESIGTLQIKVFHFRSWSVNCNLQFWQKNSFKAEISIITATLVFLINFDSHMLDAVDSDSYRRNRDSGQTFLYFMIELNQY